jgi:hypothetical protein
VTKVALDYEERKSIKEEVLSIADERYVHITDCNEKQETVNKRFANDDKRIDKLIDRIDLWSKLLWVIASSSIGALVLEFFGLIFK